jgi:hypothetical protein
VKEADEAERRITQPNVGSRSRALEMREQVSRVCDQYADDVRHPRRDAAERAACALAWADGEDSGAMAQIEIVAQAIRKRWLSQGLWVRALKPHELEVLRQLSPDGVPADYEAFLRVAGVLESEDRVGIRFWLPKEVRATREVLADAGLASNSAWPSVIIADYMEESWWYALWIGGPFRGQVSLALGDSLLGDAEVKDPQAPLGTLVDFLLAYMSDDARLYPPPKS